MFFLVPCSNGAETEGNPTDSGRCVTRSASTTINSLPGTRYSRDVGEMEGGRGREDVLEILGAGFLESVERGVGVVLGQALVVQAVPRQRHGLMLGQRHADDLPVHLLAIQVAHGFGHRERKVRGEDAAA